MGRFHQKEIFFLLVIMFKKSGDLPPHRETWKVWSWHIFQYMFVLSIGLYLYWSCWWNSNKPPSVTSSIGLTRAVGRPRFEGVSPVPHNQCKISNNKTLEKMGIMVAIFGFFSAKIGQKFLAGIFLQSEFIFFARNDSKHPQMRKSANNFLGDFFPQKISPKPYF